MKILFIWYVYFNTTRVVEHDLKIHFIKREYHALKFTSLVNSIYIQLMDLEGHSSSPLRCFN